MNLNEIYETNEDFRNYVDRYCAEWDKTKEQAFEELIIKDVAKSYLPKGCNYSKGVTKNV